MLKSISNLGTVLSKTEQKTINGGLMYCKDGASFEWRLINGKWRKVACAIQHGGGSNF